MRSSVGVLNEVNCIYPSGIEGIVGAERLIRHFFHIHWTHLRNIGALETRQRYMHTHIFLHVVHTNTHTQAHRHRFMHRCAHTRQHLTLGALFKNMFPEVICGCFIEPW